MSQTAQDPAQQPADESSRRADTPAAAGPEPRSAGGDPRADRVAAAVRTWQRHLVDLGGRNTLLWYRDLPSGTLDLTTAHPGGMAMLLAGRPTRLSDLVREPTALEEARRRVRTIRGKTLELHEERGISAGYIAVGMATWRVAGARRSPCAPVLLRSCVLRPTGAAQQDFDIDLGEDVELNPVLEHYLRSEQGIEIDPEVLEEMATFTKGFDPLPVYAALTRICHRIPAFQIAPRLVLGTFSYAKLPMVADLAAQLGTLADHDVVAALAGDPGALEAVRDTVPDFPFDSDPARERMVLDADSSQKAVVDAVRWGANLVIQGPPGTGKSQTITNLIACLASQGKRTLFVAEKRAAIDAVLGRLERLGLGDLVLDVHDGMNNRRRLAQDLGRTIDRARAAQDPDTAGIERTLAERRTRLMNHCSALHDKREPWGVSAFDAQVALAQLWARRTPPISRVRLHGDVLADISRERVTELSQSLTEAASLGAWTEGDTSDDPWYGARVTSPGEAAQALEIVDRLGGKGMDAVQERLGTAMREAGLPEAKTPADWGRALALVEQVRQTLEVFRIDVFDLTLTDMVGATADKEYREVHGLRMGVWSRMRLRRQARGLLRPGAPPQSLHSALKVAQEQRARWVELVGSGGRPGVPGEIDEAQDTYDTLAGDLVWLGARLAPTAAGGDLLETSCVELHDRLAALARRRDRLAVLPRVVSLIDELRGSGMGPLVDDLAGRGVSPIDVGPEMDFVWWTSLLDEVSVRDSAYGAHDGEFLRRVGSEYIEADHAHLAGTVDRVRAAVGRRLREVLEEHPEQEALVRVEAAKTRRHRPMRDLLPRASETLTAIKPCWAMSPLVVASILPAGRWFDVVIFDESSQIPPAQAVSAISRATQVVVAGDERQLPPTSFSTAAVDEDGIVDTGARSDDALTEGSESILDVLSAVLPVRRLTWHYRSLDERLIAFANTQMYDGTLVTFPGTGEETVVGLEVVDGSAPVQPGQEPIESTQAEVDRVVDLVLLHARTRPGESLGVIALGIKHATRIGDALRLALAAGAGVGDFFDEDRAERFFVKNLERVQGDERDAIIVSIGYGKTPHGRVLHRFGPLNLEGGERRLNVAITRARRRMTVVSSFTAADLDPARLKARGALMLRDFLLYAAQGGAEPVSQAQQADGQGAPGGVARDAPAKAYLDPLVADLAFRLRSEGLVVHTGYGTSAQRLDLAVEDPQQHGRVLVAVESDGLRYAAMSSTRDRDRLRVEQLRRLGWEHVRVWSTDLFRDPARDVARVIAAVRAASAARPAGPRPADAHRADVTPADAGTPDVKPADIRPRAAEKCSKPEQTRDDTDAGWGERSQEDAHDQWLRDQRPPHWG
ncbi:MAG TPA: AAA domain-containing protein [Dermatophilaceae bacterium]